MLEPRRTVHTGRDISLLPVPCPCPATVLVWRLIVNQSLLCLQQFLLESHNNTHFPVFEMRRVRRYLLESIPFVAMVIVEFLDVGLTTLSKAAMSRGMNHFVFVVYSNALATFILFPSSFIFNTTTRPPLSFSLICKFFLLGLVGYVCNLLTLYLFSLWSLYEVN